MRSTRLALALAAAACVLGPGAPTAHAAGNLDLACAFTAETSAVGGLAPAVPYVGSNVRVSLTGTANCVGRNGILQVLILDDLPLSATGTYESFACGTGVLWIGPFGPLGMAGDGATLTKGATAIIGVKFVLPFAAGAGAIEPSTSNFEGLADTTNLDGNAAVLTDDSGKVIGAADIRPSTGNQPQDPTGNSGSPPGNALFTGGNGTNCLTKLDVAGAFTLASTP